LFVGDGAFSLRHPLYFFFNSSIDAFRAAIFSSQWMKTLTFTAIVALAWHAWVGAREVLMDYAKPTSLRMVFYMLAIVWLISCAGWAVQVLWRL